MGIEANPPARRPWRVPRTCHAVLGPSLTVLLTLASLTGVWAVRAQAPANPVGADAARLRALLPSERALLMPHLDDGPVMLTEFSNEQTELPAVTLMARVHAPADLVADVVSHPERYGAFMPALDEVEVHARQGLQVAYSWHWTVAIFTLRGDNVMTVYPGHPTRGHLIEVTSTNGDLGVGRFLFRIYPETPESCVLVFATRIDMRDANYLSQQMASGGNSVNRTINIALAMTMLLATVDESQRLHGYITPEPVERPLVRPSFDVDRYANLLARGDLVFLHLEGDRLHGVSSLARSGTSVARMRGIMVSPEEFGESLMEGSRSHTIEVTEQGTRFGWVIPVPLVSVGGEMMLRETEPGGAIEVDGLRGSLESARFRFDTHAFPWREAAIVGWSQFDPGETTRLVRRVIEGNAYFSHGLVAAVQVMIIRSLRTRSQRMGP
ncbi:MAG: SRPBCC family protein [Myxococcales bacterium]|nr:SRPBCC family protein [Myxococcales bacterium]MCB9630010.1 SRPBCC family protein [Sandaracinaceae bacterium]